MNDSPWFVEHKNIFHLSILTLLIISMVGPWMFDRIFVPAEYTCSPPNIRLLGDFCGVPVSGVQFFGLFAGGFFYMLFEVIRGTFASRSRELLVGLLVLPIIPIFTTLLSIWKKETHRLRTIDLVSWILAFLLTLTLFILQITNQGIRLWGLWLYILVAVSAVVLEIILLKRKTDHPV